MNFNYHNIMCFPLFMRVATLFLFVFFCTWKVRLLSMSMMVMMMFAGS